MGLSEYSNHQGSFAVLLRLGKQRRLAWSVGGGVGGGWRNGKRNTLQLRRNFWLLQGYRVSAVYSMTVRFPVTSDNGWPWTRSFRAHTSPSPERTQMSRLSPSSLSNLHTEVSQVQVVKTGALFVMKTVARKSKHFDSPIPTISFSIQLQAKKFFLCLLRQQSP